MTEAIKEKLEQKGGERVKMVFYVFRCKYCGKWGSKEIRIKLQKSTFKCVYCGKSTKIKKKNTFGLALMHKGPFGLGIEAANITKQNNARC